MRLPQLRLKVSVKRLFFTVALHMHSRAVHIHVKSPESSLSVTADVTSKEVAWPPRSASRHCESCGAAMH